MIPKELISIIGEYTRPTVQQYSDRLTSHEKIEACKYMLNVILKSGEFLSSEDAKSLDDRI